MPNTVRTLSRAELYSVFKTDQAVKLVEELINAINNIIPADVTVVQDALDAHLSDAADAHQAGAIGNTPAGNIAATTVQAAINELDAEKVPAARTVNGHALSADVTVTASDVGAVPTTRTVNGHALSANVTVTAADVGAPAGSGTSSGTNTGDQFTAETASTLIGRGAAAGAGPAQEITLGTGLTMSGTTLNAAGGGTGDVVGPAGAVNLNVPLFDGVTGKLIKDSGKALNAAGVGLGSVTNDAQTKAAIVPNTVPSAGQVLVGNAGGTAYAPVSLSGDLTVSSAGVVTLSGERMLANVTLGVAGTSLSSGTFAACKFLRVEIRIAGYAGSDTASMQFNADTGANYRYHWILNNPAATTFIAGLIGASTDRIKIGSSDTVRVRKVVAEIDNDPAQTEKMVGFPMSMIGTGSAATQSTRQMGNGAWISAAATSITRIDLVSTSNMNAGTQLIVYGCN